MDPRTDHWHLDKKVPIALIATLVVQAAMGLWFAAKLEARVQALETAQMEQRQRDDRQDQAMRDTAALIRSDLGYIRGQLDQLIRESAKK